MCPSEPRGYGVPLFNVRDLRKQVVLVENSAGHAA